MDSNTQLVARIVSGDESAEAEFYEQHRRGVAAIIRQVVRNRLDAPDLVQETFIIALQKIRRGELRDAESLTAFVKGVAKNVALNWVRRKAATVETDAETAPEPVASDPSPYDEVLKKEEAILVRKVLRGLRSKRDRELIIRFYLEEEDKGKICEEYGLSAGQFNTVICRAREKYKKLFEKALGRKKDSFKM
jgi:RNA polymerase sigma-70 factor (ECF subfamily)